jgi:putative Holliday junction resolvase
VRADANTVLAFDYGLRHIGIAVGNRELQSSQPLCIIKAKDGVPNWTDLARLLDEWRPGLGVVGHPLNMDGTESEMSLRAAKFSRQLEGRFALDVVLVDERLSSREAKAQAREAGHRGDYSKQPIDDQAAALILASFWEREGS